MSDSTFDYDDDGPLVSGYSLVPHGLWSADIPHGAKVLLGWLHSHERSYLQRITGRQAREAMGGSSSVLKWLTDLEAAGFITIIRNGANNRTSFRLRSEPYRTLCGVRNRTTDRSEIGQLTDPKSDHIEEHVEDQEKKTSSSTSSTETDEVFERFWKAYPRKTGTSKKKAASAFKSATKRGHLDQIRDGFKRDCAMWTRERRAPEHIPHAATWLNEERYMPETDAPMPSFAEAQQQTVRPRQIRPNGSVWELDDDGNEVCIFDPKASA